MKIYPVRFWNAGENAKMKHVRVKPFTSLVDARNFRKEVSDKPNIEAELLDVEDYSLNKTGVLEAFDRGQKLLLESDFVQGQ